jgi:hypothetical protein
MTTKNLSATTTLGKPPVIVKLEVVVVGEIFGCHYYFYIAASPGKIKLEVVVLGEILG